MAKFDWYSSTLRGSEDAILAELVRGVDLADVRPGRALHGYHRGADVVRGDHVLARVWWGGNPGVHVQSSGPDSHLVAGVIKASWPHHRVTRADACEDWHLPGLFDRLHPPLTAYAVDHGIRISQQGDWIRGEGRTLYLGARSSAAQLVLYEKGHQIGPPASPDWVRLEARCYPKGDAREDVARWQPEWLFGSTRWMRGALETIGWDALQAQSIGTVWRAPDDARARRALVGQYGAVMARWAHETGGWDAIGAVLRDAISEAEALHRHADQPAAARQAAGVV